MCRLLFDICPSLFYNQPRMENVETAPDQNIQSVESAPSEVPQFSKSINWPAILAVLVAGIALLGLVGYLAFQNYQLKIQLSGIEPTTGVAATPTTTPTKPQPIPTIDETAGWKVYSSKVYGFVFKYPQDYTVSEVQIMGEVRVVPKNRDELPAIGNLGYEMGIDYLDNPRGLTSQQCFDDWVVEMEPKSVTGRKDVMVGDVVGYQGILRSGGAFNPDVYTFAANDKRVLRVFFSKGSLEYPVVADQEVVFNQILSTFKFTD